MLTTPLVQVQLGEDLKRQISDRESTVAGSGQDMEDHVETMVDICEKIGQTTPIIGISHYSVADADAQDRG